MFNESTKQPVTKNVESGNAVGGYVALRLSVVVVLKLLSDSVLNQLCRLIVKLSIDFFSTLKIVNT